MTQRWIAALLVGALVAATSHISGTGLASAQEAASAPPAGQWSTSTLSQARYGLAATAVGGTVLFAGGFGGLSKAVDMYDGTTGQWSTAALSQARERLAATTVRTKALFAGGNIDNSPVGTSDVVDIYDAGTGRWSTATLSQRRADLVATSAGAKALFAGGDDGRSLSHADVVDIYDGATGQWSTARLSQGRRELAATSVGTVVLFAGGESGWSAAARGAIRSAVVDIYDDATGQWSTAALSQARERLAATTVGTKALFAGGAGDGNAPSAVVDIYDDATGQWSTAALSQTRERLAVTSAGAKALFAGGDDGRSLSHADVVDIYDSATGQWSTATLSEARRGLAATTVGTKALFAGGSTGDRSSDVVDVYDSPTGRWSAAKLSQPRTELAATAVSTRALFAGGVVTFVPQLSLSNMVDIYDHVTGQWSTATLTQARWGLAATSVGTKALFAGGTINFSPEGPSDVVDIYDSTTGRWRTARLSQPRWGPAATTVGTKVFFAGGLGPRGFSNVVDVYDDATGQWSTAALSQARKGLAATTVGTKALFAGGTAGGVVGGTGTIHSDVVDIYDSATGQWSVATLRGSRSWLAATSVGTIALLAGGAYGRISAPSPEVDIYDGVTGQWTTATLSQHRLNLAAATAGNKAIFAGGHAGSPGYSSVVDIFEGTVAGPSASPRGLLPAPPLAPPVAATAAPRDARYFHETSFRVDHDPFWAYFTAMGGVPTFGYPVSRTLPFLGCTTQVFQRQLLQQCGSGAPVQTMNLLDPDLMPYDRINGSSFPTHDPQVAQAAPPPGVPGYGRAVLEYLRGVAPDAHQGLPVRFFAAFVGTVPGSDPEGDPDSAALVNLQIWGFPTSRPIVDPRNANFVYQRFQRGILHYDHATGATQAILLGDWFKSLLTDRGQPPDLEAQARAAGSRFLRQYCPGAPQWVCRPAELPGTDLTIAFEPQ